MRRTIRGWIALVLCAVVGCGGDPKPAARSAGAAADAEAVAPSVLLISIDTLRADHLGCYGHGGASTPNIDGLAGRGVLFENAVTPVPVTLPAHASLLTGLLPGRHGVRDNGVYRLPGDVGTLAGSLAAHGYDTAAVVGAEVLDRGYGLDRGFRTYDDRVDPAGLLAIPERRADQVTDAALAAAAGLRAPFFLFVHYFDPHASYRPPPPFDGAFASRPYDGEIAFVDQQIGRLLEGLRAGGAFDGAVVAVVSDHGEGLGEHGEAAHGIFLYQSTVHVPWILVAPGRLPAGKRSALFAGLIDVMPTLLDLAGVPVPPGLDGRSLRAEAAGPSGAAESRWLPLESEFAFNAYRWAPLRGLTDGSTKWIGAPTPELYDLTADPGETRSLAASDPARTARLEALWRERRAGDRREPIPLDDPDPDQAKRLERLESLGYVSSPGPGPGAATGLPDPKTVIGTLDRINEARRLMAARSAPAAERILESVLGESPDNVSALILLGASRIESGQPGRAADPLRRAEALAPHKADIPFNLGLALLGAGDDAGAVAAWRRALRISPRHEAASINLADLLLQTGRLDDAATVLAEARAAKVDHPILDYLDGRLALARGDRAAARDALNRALARPLPPHVAQDARRLLAAAAGPR